MMNTGISLIGVVFLLFMLACQTPDRSKLETSSSAIEQPAENYPEAMLKVLQAHGGLAQWRNMQSLYFEIEKDQQNEKHFIQLQNRLDRVEGANFVMGYDGQDVWVDADTTYKGNAEFYHNLMFYFYAMPFVLADPGINYQQIDPLIVQGTEYPGIAISYDEGIGTSPKDEYLLFYHPDSFEMAWLGYTATYFSKEKSTDFSWIAYSDWTTVNGLKLPTTLTWHQQQDGVPTEARNSVNFVNISPSEEILSEDLFIGP